MRVLATLRRYFVYSLVVLFIFTILLRERISPLNFTWTEKTKELTWIIEGKTTDLLQENTTRCSVEDLGCFTLLKDAKPSKVDAGMTQNSCFEFCFQSKRDYAGLSSNGRCYCSDAAAKHVTSSKCDLACSADNSNNCTHENTIRLYRKRRGCHRGMSPDLLSSVVIGSVQLPETLAGAMSAWKHPNMTDAQCLLICESLGMALALPITEKEVCLCSDLASMFVSPEKMNADLDTNTSFGIADSRHILYRTNVEECRPKRFLNQQGPAMVLFSHPGSGNTWVRHLIEVATRIYTGSVYGDPRLNKGGMLGENLSFLARRTITIKEHMLKNSAEVLKAYSSAIVILRNPYDVSLAEYARISTNQHHTGLVNPKKYESADFKEFSQVLQKNWLDRATKLFDIVPKVLVVYYEDLVDDPVREIRRIVSFLPQDLVPQGEALNKTLLCMKLDLTGDFKRPPKGLKRNPYDLNLQKSFDQAIKSMDKLLKSKEKAPLPKSYYEKWHDQGCGAAGACQSTAPLFTTEEPVPNKPCIGERDVKEKLK